MSKQLTNALIGLADADSLVNGFVIERDEILEVRNGLQKQIDQLQTSLEECEAKLESRRSEQVEETNKLKSEEMRIVEQRKQLTTMGSKSAKLVERQIDLASQTLQQMEEKAVKAIEEVERLENDKDDIREKLSELQSQLKVDEETNDSRLTEIEGEVSKLEKSRDGSIGKLDDRLAKLYDKVHGRYPESAVSIAQKGSCRKCYRALPKQMYNQILSGTTSIQCPGCSRILVYQPAAD